MSYCGKKGCHCNTPVEECKVCEDWFDQKDMIKKNENYICKECNNIYTFLKKTTFPNHPFRKPFIKRAHVV